jgi:tRNA-uridine 2-sulfurtransferase
MSGGVDSSVVAHMLVEQGHEVVGIMMKLWTDPLAPESRDFLPKKCCSIEHIQRARSVCNALNIPFYTVNLEQQFKDKVVDFYLDAHKRSDTPNPCIECNRTIKFGALLDQVDDLKYDMLATGHYAKVEPVATTYTLRKATDTKKDQSYYLYTLTQAKLAKVLFPLGGMHKSEVFALAKKYKVAIPETYAESEDLCFYPENSPNKFLERYIPESISPGNIIDELGNTVGTHKGLPMYTIGQRRGLGIGGLSIPLHVERKDVQSNTIYVTKAGQDMKSTFTMNSLHWINEAPATNELTVRVSSLGTMHPCALVAQGEDGTVQLTKPVRGLAAGQSAVFYSGTTVLGGGIITQQT